VNNVSCAPDGIGGAVICWFGASPRNPASPFIALRYLHVSYEGTIDTPDTGVVVSSIATAATCIGDGVGGGYVAFEELRTTSNPDIVAQRYNSAGVPQWTPINSATGRNLCPVVGLQRIRAIQDDGAGGVFVVWSDSRTTGTTPLYTTRVLPNGTLPWTSTGVRITPVSSGVRIVGSARSSLNGLWLVWRDANSPTSIPDAARARQRHARVERAGEPGRLGAERTVARRRHERPERRSHDHVGRHRRARHADRRLGQPRVGRARDACSRPRPA
jgi:hypothetical protein